MRWLLTIVSLLVLVTVTSQFSDSKKDGMGGPIPLGRPGIEISERV